MKIKNSTLGEMLISLLVLIVFYWYNLNVIITKVGNVYIWYFSTHAYFELKLKLHTSLNLK